jgi:hypothetical protein
MENIVIQKKTYNKFYIIIIFLICICIFYFLFTTPKTSVTKNPDKVIGATNIPRDINNNTSSVNFLPAYSTIANLMPSNSTIANLMPSNSTIANLFNVKPPNSAPSSKYNSFLSNLLPQSNTPNLKPLQSNIANLLPSQTNTSNLIPSQYKEANLIPAQSTIANYVPSQSTIANYIPVNLIPSQSTIANYLLSTEYFDNTYVNTNGPKENYYYAIFYIVITNLIEITPQTNYDFKITINIPESKKLIELFIYIYDKLVQSGLKDYIISLLQNSNYFKISSPDFQLVSTQINNIINIILDKNTFNSLSVIIDFYSNFLSNTLQDINPILNDIFTQMLLDPFIIQAYQQLLLNPLIQKSMSKTKSQNTIIQNLIIIISNYIEIQYLSTNKIIINVNSSSLIIMAGQNESMFNDALSNIYKIVINSQLLPYMTTFINNLMQTNKKVRRSKEYVHLCMQLLKFINILYDQNTIYSFINLINKFFSLLLFAFQTPLFSQVVKKIIEDPIVQSKIEEIIRNPDPLVVKILNTYFSLMYS